MTTVLDHLNYEITRAQPAVLRIRWIQAISTVIYLSGVALAEVFASTLWLMIAIVLLAPLSFASMHMSRSALAGLKCPRCRHSFSYWLKDQDWFARTAEGTSVPPDIRSCPYCHLAWDEEYFLESTEPLAPADSLTRTRRA